MKSSPLMVCYLSNIPPGIIVWAHQIQDLNSLLRSQIRDKKLCEKSSPDWVCSKPPQAYETRYYCCQQELTLLKGVLL